MQWVIFTWQEANEAKTVELGAVVVEDGLISEVFNLLDSRECGPVFGVGSEFLSHEDFFSIVEYGLCVFGSKWEVEHFGESVDIVFLADLLIVVAVVSSNLDFFMDHKSNLLPLRIDIVASIAPHLIIGVEHNEPLCI